MKSLPPSTQFDVTMSDLTSALEYFNLKCELNELSRIGQKEIRAEFELAFRAILLQEFSKAHGYINRAAALMN